MPTSFLLRIFRKLPWLIGLYHTDSGEQLGSLGAWASHMVIAFVTMRCEIVTLDVSPMIMHLSVALSFLTAAVTGVRNCKTFSGCSVHNNLPVLGCPVLGDSLVVGCQRTQVISLLEALHLFSCIWPLTCRVELSQVFSEN